MELAGCWVPDLALARVEALLDPLSVRHAATASRAWQRPFLAEHVWARRHEAQFGASCEGDAASAFARRMRTVHRFRRPPGDCAVLAGHESTVRALAFLPGRDVELASVSSDGRLAIWARGKRPRLRLRLSRTWRAYCVAATPVEVVVGLGGGELVRVGTGDGPDDGQPAFHAVADAPVRSVAAADGVLAAGTAAGHVHVLGSSGATVDLHADQVTALRLLQGSRRLLSASRDGSLRLSSLRGGALVEERRFEHPGAVLGAAADPAGAVLATACRDDAVRLWDARAPLTAAAVAEVQTPDAPLCVEFNSPACALYSGGWENALTAYDVRSLAAPLWRHYGHDGPVRAVVCNDTHVATGSWDRTVRVYSFSS